MLLVAMREETQIFNERKRQSYERKEYMLLLSEIACKCRPLRSTDALV